MHPIAIDPSVYRNVWCVIGVIEVVGWLAEIFISHGNPIFAAIMIAYTIIVLLGFWLLFRRRGADVRA